MTREIRPFDASHLPAAAALLAKRHEADALREPRLPRQFASPEGTAPLLRELLDRATGVVAIEDGRLVGYMLGTYDLGWGGRATLVPMEGHAVDHADAVEMYRELYAAASPAWIEGGYFQHTANISAGDGAAAAAFNSLGFGQMLAFGLRDTAPIEGAGSDVRIERATEAEVAAVQELMVGLGKYNSISPLYRPYVENPTSEWPRLPLVKQQMADETCSYWLAYEGDQPVGLMIFTPPDPTELMVSPERSVYLWIAYVKPDTRIGGVGKALVDTGLAWARNQGLDYCTVGWFTTNVIGARFWTGRGYRPAMYRVERRFDERIAWAKVRGW